jgi:serine/threonine-protein kinase
MTIDTLDALLAALRDSGLLDEEQLARLPALAARFPDSAALTAELERTGWLTPYQAEELRAGRGGELVLGQYVVLSMLGQGGMGKVFKARHRLMKRVVALKVIRPALLAEPRAVSRFHREIEAVSRLSHPNIVAAFDADQVGNRHFLVTEYVEGTDLARLVKEHGPLPAGLACDCVRQAALGLQHAHEQGLVHRDIKPANLLLSRSAAPGSTPVVKILDMGLARLHAEEGDGLTHTGAVMGTPDYIAPEQASDAHLVDIRADLYSLGCTLYFLLTGEAPFPGGTPMEKLFKHRYVAPRPVVVRRPELPPAVAAVVGKLMAKRPDERYQTPSELAEVLAPLAAYNPEDEASTIYLPKPPPAVEAGPGTIRPGAPAGETMHAEGAATRVEGAAEGSGKSPGDWSASPVPYVEPASPAGAVPAVAPVRKEVPPRRRPPVVLAAALVLVGAVVLAGAVALPSLSSLWRRPSGGATLAEDDRGRPPVATVPGEQGSERDNTKATSPEPRQTPKADTGKENPKGTGKPPPKDTGKPPVPVSLPPGPLNTPIPPDMVIGKAAFAPDASAAVVISSTTNGLGLYDRLDGKLPPRYTPTTFPAEGFPAVASAVATSAGGKSVFYAALIPAAGYGIGLWLAPDGTATELQTSVPDAVQFLSASEKGDYVLGGTKSDDRTRYELYWWDVTTPTKPKRVRVGQQDRPASLRGVALSADGTRAVSLANGEGDGVRRWEVKEGKGKERQPAWTRGVSVASACAISPAGNFVLLCDDDSFLHLLAFESGEERLKQKVEAKYVECLAVVEEAGRPLWMVCGDRFGQVKVWDANGQAVPVEGRPHSKKVLAIGLSSDCRYVYSLGADRTVRRWLTPRALK